MFVVLAAHKAQAPEEGLMDLGDGSFDEDKAFRLRCCVGGRVAASCEPEQGRAQDEGCPYRSRISHREAPGVVEGPFPFPR